jgi:hypothetical protein
MILRHEGIQSNDNQSLSLDSLDLFRGNKKYFPVKQGTYNRREDVHGAFPHSLLISCFVIISILVKNVQSIFCLFQFQTKQ